MRLYKKAKKEIESLAHERIRELFEQAKKTSISHPKRAKRYVEIARNISMRTKTRMPYGSSRLFCRKCNSFFRFGINVRVRTRDSRQIYQCKECKTIKRFPFYKEIKEKRRI